MNIETLAINTIRTLSIDAVEKAKSGHPGMPLGCAPIAYSLFTSIMNHYPSDHKWINRDRFILSAGHGSMLLYSVLHLSGYPVSLDDIKQFRQSDSITPGHPEHFKTPGVETTTGPLGQGFANGVGMAIAQAYLASLFNKPGFNIFDHFIYCICSDGDLMEGVSYEAASLAGHLKLNKLIYFYDDNGISIDGKTSLSFSEDVEKRFLAQNWQVLRIDNVNDISQIKLAVEKAKAETGKPSLIITKTVIGFGSPNKSGSETSHGSPLGENEIKLTKEALGWNYPGSFTVPVEVKEHFSSFHKKFKSVYSEWNNSFEKYKSEYPVEYNLLSEMLTGKFNLDDDILIKAVSDKSKNFATRQVSGFILNAIYKTLPSLFGGSADLAESNNTFLKGGEDFSATNYSGRNIRFGIREHSMGSILNGMALYGGIIPYGATFLIFSDYMRPAVRLAALEKLKIIYVFTHDSIGLGEDGPTHQPVEQLSSLRTIPGITVIRPADPLETAAAFKYAINNAKGPVALSLTRQAVIHLPHQSEDKLPPVDKGAYILKDSAIKPDIILIASGSEAGITLEAANILENEGINTRVISMPSQEIFDSQTADYKESIIPSEIQCRVAVEAGVSLSWYKYIGSKGRTVCLDRFGASAPAGELFKKFGFTPENIVKVCKETLSSI
ncbi:MAG: transketolase [Ignavibacteriaceae bacterium]|nr:transketolase [Ignavibacteriaceae bacterium]